MKKLLSRTCIVAIIISLLLGFGASNAQAALVKQPTKEASALIFSFFKKKGSKEKEASQDSSISGSSQLYLDLKYEDSIFNDYDIEVYLDEKKVGTVKNGNYFTNLSKVDNGTHKIVFYKKGNQEVYGKSEVKVSADTTYSCTVKSGRKEIKVKKTDVVKGLVGNAIEVKDLRGANLKDACEKLENAGFVNVIIQNIQNDDKIKEKEEWTVVSQSVDPGRKEDKTKEIKLSCARAEDVVLSDDEVHFRITKGKAVRATVVALTNGVVTDVVNKETKAIEESKLHSYTDFSGAYITVNNKGKWTEDDDLVWHVKGLKFKSPNYKSSKVELSVFYDGENYHVFDLMGTLTNLTNGIEKKLSKVETSETRSVAFEVSPELIRGDREAAFERKEAREQAKKEREAEKKRAAEEAKRKAAEEAEQKRLAEEAEKREAAERAKQEAQAEEAWLSSTVYITRTGKCYHSAGCRYLQSKIKTTVREAISKGLKPCSWCLGG